MRTRSTADVGMSNNIVTLVVAVLVIEEELIAALGRHLGRESHDSPAMRYFQFHLEKGYLRTL
jgi:hypothetical protein